MTPPRRIELRQQRGQWLAKVQRSRDIEFLNQDLVAVIRDWDDRDFLSWTAKPPAYRQPAGHQNRGTPDWWNQPTYKKWNEHIENDAVVWVREGLRDASVNGTVGRNKGIWRISGVEKSEKLLAFDLVERLGDAT